MFHLSVTDGYDDGPTDKKLVILKEKIHEGFKSFKDAIETGSLNYGGDSHSFPG